MNSKLNVLLTGASGTVGTEILNQLTQFNDINLTVFDLKTTKTKRIFSVFKNKISVIYGNLSNEEDISNIPDNQNVVIHLAAIIPPQADEKPELTRNVNVLGTKILLNWLEKTSPDSFFMYSSSISVYGDRIENPLIKATDRLLPSKGDVYAQTKIEAENLIRTSKLSWTIFRLAAIMKNHKISRLMFHMPLSTKLEICTPSDTAKAFIKGIYKKNELVGKIFNLGGGEYCCTTYERFLEKSFKIYGLGTLNFPPQAFALCNFHCGRLVDGDKLEDILHFRNDTLKAYFQETKNTIPLITKILCFTFRVFIKKFLLNQSEPYNSIRKNNKSLIEQFFGKTDFSFINFSAKKNIENYDSGI
jgi:nucleoside-diphosphate-sugar epimerase